MYLSADPARRRPVHLYQAQQSLWRHACLEDTVSPNLPKTPICSWWSVFTFYSPSYFIMHNLYLMSWSALPGYWNQIRVYVVICFGRLWSRR